MRKLISDFVSAYFVHLVISLVALGFVSAHLICPNLEIDTIVLALLALAALPWLGKVFESIEITGIGKVKYHELLRAEQLASKAGLLNETVQTLKRDETPLYVSIADEDPNLALAGLRLAIEKALRDVAAAHGIDMERKGLEHFSESILTGMSSQTSSAAS
jgi:hypothetical protein